MSSLPLNLSPTFSDDFSTFKFLTALSGNINLPSFLCFLFKENTVALLDGSLGNASHASTGLYLSTFSKCCSLVILPSIKSLVESSSSGVRIVGLTSRDSVTYALTVFCQSSAVSALSNSAIFF